MVAPAIHSTAPVMHIGPWFWPYLVDINFLLPKTFPVWYCIDLVVPALKMADLEAVLADVSYLMAMEKSKSTPAARASKKIILPEPR